MLHHAVITHQEVIAVLLLESQGEYKEVLKIISFPEQKTEGIF